MMMLIQQFLALRSKSRVAVHGVLRSELFAPISVVQFVTAEVKLKMMSLIFLEL